MAAVDDPALILLDEPTSGVSVDEKIGMMESVIEPLKGEDATVLFIEHDMDLLVLPNALLPFMREQLSPTGQQQTC